MPPAGRGSNLHIHNIENTFCRRLRMRLLKTTLLATALGAVESSAAALPEIPFPGSAPTASTTRDIPNHGVMTHGPGATDIFEWLSSSTPMRQLRLVHDIRQGHPNLKMSRPEDFNNSAVRKLFYANYNGDQLPEQLEFLTRDPEFHQTLCRRVRDSSDIRPACQVFSVLAKNDPGKARQFGQMLLPEIRRIFAEDGDFRPALLREVGDAAPALLQSAGFKQDILREIRQSKKNPEFAAAVFNYVDMSAAATYIRSSQFTNDELSDFFAAVPLSKEVLNVLKPELLSTLKNAKILRLKYEILDDVGVQEVLLARYSEPAKLWSHLGPEVLRHPFFAEIAERYIKDKGESIFDNLRRDFPSTADLPLFVVQNPKFRRQLGLAALTFANRMEGDENAVRALTSVVYVFGTSCPELYRYLIFTRPRPFDALNRAIPLNPQIVEHMGTRILSDPLVVSAFEKLTHACGLLEIDNYNRFDDFGEILRGRFAVADKATRVELQEILGREFFAGAREDKRPILLYIGMGFRDDHNSASRFVNTPGHLSSHQIVYFETHALVQPEKVLAALRRSDRPVTDVIVNFHGSPESLGLGGWLGSANSRTVMNFVRVTKPRVAKGVRYHFAACSVAKTDVADNLARGTYKEIADIDGTVFGPAAPTGAVVLTGNIGEFQGLHYMSSDCIEISSAGERVIPKPDDSRPKKQTDPAQQDQSDNRRWTLIAVGSLILYGALRFTADAARTTHSAGRLMLRSFRKKNPAPLPSPDVPNYEI